jgi:hypothetical protein
MKSTSYILAIVLSLLTLLSAGIGLGFFNLGESKMGDWGDYLGGVAGVVALIWLIIGHLDNQREILQTQNDLKSQLELTREAVGALLDVAADIGCDWAPNLYPRAAHLAKASESSLRNLFGSWPLSTVKKKSRATARNVTEEDVNLLFARYQAIGIGRDRLSYTPEMTNLTRQFNDATALACTEATVWKRLLGRLKRGNGRVGQSDL